MGSKGTKLFGLLVALMVLIGLLAPGAAVAGAGDWSQFHGDAAHTGFSSSKAPNTPSLKWVSADIGVLPATPVAVGDGKVFVVCTNAVKCLSQADGSVLWSHAVSGAGTWGSWAGPAYNNGRVFMATDGICCLDAGDGRQLWKYSFPGSHWAVNGCAVVAEGKVVAGDWDGNTYYCVSEDTGEPLWQYHVAGYAQGTPAYHNGRFFLTSWEYVGGHIYCVNASNGSLAWHSAGKTDGTYDWDTCGSVTVADGKCFFTTYNFAGYGELMALNEADGSVAWGPRQIERSDSTPAYAAGRLYVCGGCVGYTDEGERTYCFNASNGELIWQTPAGSEPGALDVGNWTCSVAVADGKVFVGKPDHGGDPMAFDYEAIYALNAATGAEIWHYDHGGASPSVAGGVVYTVAEGKVWAFEADTPAWDVNGDGSINVLDLSRVGDRFGETGAPGWIPEDINRDGVINVLDMSVIGDHFGE